MKTKKSGMNPSELVSVCLEAFRARGVKTEVVDNREFKVILKDDEYTVELLSMDEIDAGSRIGSKIGKDRAGVKTVKNHSDVLDVCLHALSNNESARKSISDLTTDGDNHDCEAIFNLKDWWYMTLAVR